MVVGENLGVLVGAIALGAIHGIEPGHGWPVAASCALDQSNKWVYGFAASLIIGIGHLISSLAMVAVFFYAKSYFNLTQINDPIVIFEGIEIGGPVSLVAGILLIALGIREYHHGHSHSHDDDGHTHHETDEPSAHDHSHSHSHTHTHEEDHPPEGLVSRVKRRLPFGDGHAHSHDELSGAADRGLLGIAWFAFIESKENTRAFRRGMNPTTPLQPTVNGKAGYSNVLKPNLYKKDEYKCLYRRSECWKSTALTGRKSSTTVR